MPNVRLEAKKIVRNTTKDIKIGEEVLMSNKSSSATLSIFLLKELASKYKSEISLSSILYGKPDIFVGAQKFKENDKTSFGTVKKYRSVVMSQVISVSVGGQHIKNLKSPLIIDNTIKEENNLSLSSVHSTFSNVSDAVKSKPGSYREGETLYKVTEKCVFWNFETSSWSTKGCRTIKDEMINSTRNIKCSCTHLTHFAVILVSFQAKNFIISHNYKLVLKLLKFY